MKPADLVRTEAAALTALAMRLEGAMAEPFARAVELILRCGGGNGRVVVTGDGKERDHRCEDRGYAEFDGSPRCSASCRGRYMETWVC